MFFVLIHIFIQTFYLLLWWNSIPIDLLPIEGNVFTNITAGSYYIFKIILLNYHSCPFSAQSKILSLKHFPALSFQRKIDVESF